MWRLHVPSAARLPSIDELVASTERKIREMQVRSQRARMQQQWEAAMGQSNIEERTAKKVVDEVAEATQRQQDQERLSEASGGRPCVVGITAVDNGGPGSGVMNLLRRASQTMGFSKGKHNDVEVGGSTSTAKA